MQRNTSFRDEIADAGATIECSDNRRALCNNGRKWCRGPEQEIMPMSDTEATFVDLVGRTALRLWPDLPRDIQERLFETAAPGDARQRHDLAVFLHNRHPRTAHPPKPAS
jgi:hypothetical protein